MFLIWINPLTTFVWNRIIKIIDDAQSAYNENLSISRRYEWKPKQCFEHSAANLSAQFAKLAKIVGYGIWCEGLALFFEFDWTFIAIEDLIFFFRNFVLGIHSSRSKSSCKARWSSKRLTTSFLLKNFETSNWINGTKQVQWGFLKQIKFLIGTFDVINEILKSK